MCLCVCWLVYICGSYLLVRHVCASKMLSWVGQLWCDFECSGTDPDQRSFYFWIQTAYTEHIMASTEQDTCNQPLTWSHLESLSSSLKAGANPCGVYHTTGTTAGWSVCSLSWTSWWAETYGYYLGWCALIWISTNGLHQSISECTVSYVHLRRYKGLSPVWCSKSSHCYWQIWLFQWKIVLEAD